MSWCSGVHPGPAAAAIGAALQKLQRDVVLCVDDRQVQRAGAVGQGEVDVRAGLHQRLNSVGVARADGERERREALVGAGVHIRPRRHQGCDDLRVSLGGGPHERRLAAPTLPRVDPGTGAVSEQRGHAVDDSGSRRDHQRGLALR